MLQSSSHLPLRSPPHSGDNSSSCQNQQQQSLLASLFPFTLRRISHKQQPFTLVLLSSDEQPTAARPADADLPLPLLFHAEQPLLLRLLRRTDPISNITASSSTTDGRPTPHNCTSKSKPCAHNKDINYPDLKTGAPCSKLSRDNGTVKARNSNPFRNNSNAVSVTTQWETFESGVGSLNAPPPPRPVSGFGSLDAPPPPRPAVSGVGSLNAPPPIPMSVVGSLNTPPLRPLSTVLTDNWEQFE